jgi:hypothetical protein
VIEFAPPLDQTPTFPPRLLVGTLTTAEAPRTVKFATSEPNIGEADTNAGQRSAATAAAPNIFKQLDFIFDAVRSSCNLIAFLETFLI